MWISSIGILVILQAAVHQWWDNCVCRHWNLLLKIHGQWWNVTSLFPAPQWLNAVHFCLLADKVGSALILECLQEHWFSLRKIHGQWWNFNSLFPAPQQLSQFYLSAFLATLREQGYSIFVVHGGLPTYPDSSVTGDQGRWFSEAQVLRSPLTTKIFITTGYT